MLVILIISCSFFGYLFYFKNFHKKSIGPSEEDMLKTIEILNKSFDIENYSLHIYNEYNIRDKRFVYVSLENYNSKKYYIVDLNEEKIRKR